MPEVKSETPCPPLEDLRGPEAADFSEDDDTDTSTDERIRHETTGSVHISHQHQDFRPEDHDAAKSSEIPWIKYGDIFSDSDDEAPVLRELSRDTIKGLQVVDNQTMSYMIQRYAELNLARGRMPDSEAPLHLARYLLHSHGLHRDCRCLTINCAMYSHHSDIHLNHFTTATIHTNRPVKYVPERKRRRTIHKICTYNDND